MELEMPINKPVFYGQHKKVVNSHLTIKQGFLLIFFIATAFISLTVASGIEGLRWYDNFSHKYMLEFREFDMSVQLPSARIVERKDKQILIPVISTTTTVTKSHLTEEDKKEIIKNSGYGKILTGIRMLESSNNSQRNQSAHHVDCEKVGMSNEFGYDALNDFCFGSFEESVSYLTNYIEEALTQMPLNTMLCTYNTGRATSTCEYARNFHSLDEQGKLALK